MIEDRPLFPGMVRSASRVGRVLKLGSNSRKLGSHFSKGDWIGLPIFSLSLPERTTCPTSCRVRDRCYGNRMQVAPRFTVDAALYGKLTVEIENLASMFPDGFAVRLHALGDFPEIRSVLDRRRTCGAAGSHLRLHRARTRVRDRSDPRSRVGEVGPVPYTVQLRRGRAVRHGHGRPALGAARRGDNLPGGPRPSSCFVWYLRTVRDQPRARGVWSALTASGVFAARLSELEHQPVIQREEPRPSSASLSKKLLWMDGGPGV